MNQTHTAFKCELIFIIMMSRTFKRFSKIITTEFLKLWKLIELNLISMRKLIDYLLLKLPLTLNSCKRFKLEKEKLLKLNNFQIEYKRNFFFKFSKRNKLKNFFYYLLSRNVK